MTYFLPEDYATRSDPIQFFDNGMQLVYQPHVYDLALFVARRCGAKRIIDIGCGSGAKLRPFSQEFEILGVDCAATIPLFRNTVPKAKSIECDLNSAVPGISEGLFTDSVVICADVIEHLSNPDHLARYLAGISEIAPFVFISTPDRDRVRGWLDRGPPDNRSHTMEWSASEFVRFLRSSGFSENVLCGHTINTDNHQANTTLLVISGAHAHPRGATQPKKVAAIIHCFNEVDIISEVVRHLVRQGVHVYLFDNWSTDGTWELARQLEREGALTSLNRYPERPIQEYQWAKLLKRTEEVASTIDADWVIHYDADELRYCPWPRASLVEGLSWVDSLGYNAIDFTVIDFRFLANGKDAKAPYESSLNRFQFGRRNGHFSQIKAWKNRQKVNLVSSGGHEAIFEGRRIFPLKFLTKHYPLRSIGQAQKKIFCDRLPRIKQEQTERGWHTQYNQFENDGSVSGWHPHELLPWAEHFFFTEYLVQRLSGIGVKEHTTEGWSLMSKQNQIEPGLSAEFRELYRFDSGCGCWIPKNGTKEFTYSDGDEVERRIYKTVQSAEDLSSVSVELSKKITDWPSKYHLSALRGNLLRPFTKGLKGRILEIGAGCGAITRFLGECGGEVVAIEGSQARASIAAARCRDLKNVNVIVDAVHRLPPCPTYDVVTLVGVLEYARKYFPSENGDPVDALLRHARAFLKPEGVLIVAIENQLGLKYFAGCFEDHVGVAMFGIEDRYDDSGVVTFGRRELRERIRRAGFLAQDWWYPFPDYKLPTVVASEKALSGAVSVRLEPVVGPSLEVDPQLPRSPSFMLDRAWKLVVRNNLGPDLANSFLVIAGLNESAIALENVGDVYHLAVDRRPEYAKAVVFTVASDEQVTVHRESLFPESQPSGAVPIKMKLESHEKFIEGQLWSQKLKSILTTEGWHLSDLLEWARRWYVEFLKEAGLNDNPEKLTAATPLSGSLIDSIPRNLIVRANGEAVFFDKEWSVNFPLDLGYIVFRGLYLSLFDVRWVAAPQPSVPIKRIDLFRKVLQSIGIQITDSDLARYFKIENDFQLFVSGREWGDPMTILSANLEVIRPEKPINEVGEDQSVDNLMPDPSHKEEPGKKYHHGKIFQIEMLNSEQSCPVGVEKKTHEAITNILVVKGKKDDAIFALEKLTESFPSYAPAYNDLGILYAEMERFDKALQAYEKATTLDPENAVFHKDLADFYYVKLKRTDQAIRHYEKVVAIDPKNLETLLILGNLLTADNKLTAAKSCFLKVLEMDPSNEMAEKMFDALDCRKNESSDDDPAMIMCEARILSQRGYTDRAITKLGKLVEDFPNNAIAHNDLGFLHYRNGKKKKACFHYEKALSADRTNLTILKNLADFYLVESGRFEEALRLYTTVLEQCPNDLEALKAIASICVKLERYEDAFEFFSKIQAIDSADSEVAKIAVSLRNKDASISSSSLSTHGPKKPRLNNQNPENGSSRGGMVDPDRSDRTQSGQYRFRLKNENAAIADFEQATTAAKNLNSFDVQRVESFDDYVRYIEDMREVFDQRQQEEKNLIGEGDSFRVPGICVICRREVAFHVDYFAANAEEKSRKIPNWRERLMCPHCGLINRCRAVIHIIGQILNPSEDASIFIAEQTTPVYHWLLKHYPNTVGSEFLGNLIPLGSKRPDGIRNEDLTALTFPDGSFDCVMTYDVFEHIPDYQQAFRECQRVLKPGGVMMFTAPFNSNSQDTIIRARHNPDGSVEHHHPPQYHGDPLNRIQGCLCYQVFGWDILKDLESIGFDGPGVYFYWSRELGYLGPNQMIFMAKKREEQMQRVDISNNGKRAKTESDMVSIVIPVFNKLSYTQKCLEAIQKNTPSLKYEIIVVDNASSDGTSDFLNSLTMPIKVLTNAENIGFTKACNQGARIARGKYVLFLNNDTEPAPGWLNSMVELVSLTLPLGLWAQSLYTPTDGFRRQAESSSGMEAVGITAGSATLKVLLLISFEKSIMFLAPRS